jgi:hypothetical protein
MFGVANWSSFNVANTIFIPQFLNVSIILFTPCTYHEQCVTKPNESGNPVKHLICVDIEAQYSVQ